MLLHSPVTGAKTNNDDEEAIRYNMYVGDLSDGHGPAVVRTGHDKGHSPLGRGGIHIAVRHSADKAHAHDAA
jgi:hypothetical protein